MTTSSQDNTSKLEQELRHILRLCECEDYTDKETWDNCWYLRHNDPDTGLKGFKKQQLETITALFNTELEKRVREIKQKFHEPIEHDGSFISIRIIDEVFDKYLSTLNTPKENK